MSQENSAHSNNHNRLAIYIHWPFCNSKCPYCDFTSYPITSSIDYTAWERAYIKAICFYRKLLGPREVYTIFIGGGTPSNAPYTILESIIKTISHSFQIVKDPEISIEVNPCSTDERKFVLWKTMGINRISIGVQSLNDENLQFLGRKHDVGTAKRVIYLAQKYFDNISIDLIYALPQQTISDWETELHDAISMQLHHMSLYQLSIKHNTPFAKMVESSAITMPSESDSADLYLATNDMTLRYGFNAYEVSNYAIGHAYQCKHNVTYWRYGDYIAIGPGAHARYTINGTKYATIDHPSLSQWLNAVNVHGRGIQVCKRLKNGDVKLERILMGMRMYEGVSLDLLGCFDKNKQLTELFTAGFLTVDRIKNTIAATAKGMLVLDTIIPMLIYDT